MHPGLLSTHDCAVLLMALRLVSKVDTTGTPEHMLDAMALLYLQKQRKADAPSVGDETEANARTKWLL